MKKTKDNPVNGKLYYIDPHSPNGCEKIELFTLEDACDVVRNCQDQHPEETLVVKQFEPI